MSVCTPGAVAGAVVVTMAGMATGRMIWATGLGSVTEGGSGVRLPGV